jgi:nitroreductase
MDSRPFKVSIDETSISQVIQERYSCRHYKKQPLDADNIHLLRTFIGSITPGPFGSHNRFDLIASTPKDQAALKGLGTYGFIKNPPAFIIGASVPSKYHLEDYGYLLESIILYATSLGLGSCWLGGTFTKSRFAKKINLQSKERMPAVASIGKIANPKRDRQGLISQMAESHRRLPWQALFFKNTLDSPLLPREAGKYATPLEMVRLAPSASNKQPWRVISNKDTFRFYLHRTPGYRNDLIKRILKLCDLQRIDMGIALYHFEITAQEMGLPGRWITEDPEKKASHMFGEYTASWLKEAETQ